MQRRINLLDVHYTVMVVGHPEERWLKVEAGEFQSVALKSMKDGQGIILLGEQNVRMKMAVKGETVYIRAFDRTFTLHIVNPVEQAAQETSGPGNTARAPMPGTVVEIDVAVGARVTKGQSMMTIESMKILTVITAPRDGEVVQVHFEPGATFGKNAALITLSKKEEE
ncbi:biotin/lipoyl-containing protein [Desulfobacula sp.]|uniref:acetyl-CoA carboxylase biotin carboxyl carrier protein subunit n=1 Tax=Desulfobacula sp. TaxID=2593537 RepID=UPI0026154F5C|nr:biotin/lipoyl-containing protein [Desulfobacula sp.]